MERNELTNEQEEEEEEEEGSEKCVMCSRSTEEKENCQRHDGNIHHHMPALSQEPPFAGEGPPDSRPLPSLRPC